MNILFVTPYLPNLIRVRSYQLMRHLKELGHKLTLVYYDTDRSSLEKVETGENGFCHAAHSFPLSKKQILLNGFACLPGKEPFQSYFGWQKSMFNYLSDLLRQENQFDVIHIEHMRAVKYALKLVKNNGGKNVPIVWDSVDSITHLFRQASRLHPNPLFRKFLQWEVRRTEKYEPYAASQFSATLLTSEKDKAIFEELLQENALTANISVLSNGVDLDYFRPNAHIKREPKTLVISGKMSYHANEKMVLRLVDEIMPLVWQAEPDVKVCIAGKDPGDRIRNLSSDHRITVTGFVTDIRPYLQKASLAIAPLAYGAGVQNKILESMACETPVVTTRSAISSLSVVNGQDLIAEDDNHDFAEKIIYLLNSPERMRRIGQNGRTYVEKHHSWNAIARELTNIYQSVIQNKQ